MSAGTGSKFHGSRDRPPNKTVVKLDRPDHEKQIERENKPIVRHWRTMLAQVSFQPESIPARGHGPRLIKMRKNARSHGQQGAICWKMFGRKYHTALPPGASSNISQL